MLKTKQWGSAVVLALLCAAYVGGLAGCSTPSSKRLAGCSASLNAVQRENGDLNRQLSEAKATNLELRKEIEALTSKLNESEARRIQLENSNVGLLTQRLEECRSDIRTRVDEARHLGLVEGVNKVLSSIQVRGVPYKDKGIIFDDYYYLFQVRFGSRDFVSLRVKTSKSEASFGSTLAGISGLAPAVLAAIPK